VFAVILAAPVAAAQAAVTPSSSALDLQVTGAGRCATLDPLYRAV